MSGHMIFKKAIPYICHIEQRAHFSSAIPKLKKKGVLLISSKRSELDHYLGTYYDKLVEVPLASKGWNHSKAKNDYFTVLPIPEEIKEETHSFMEFGIHTEVIEALKRYDIKSATEFQSRAYPTIYRGT